MNDNAPVLFAVFLAAVATASLPVSGETYYLKSGDGRDKSSFASWVAGSGWQTANGSSEQQYPSAGNAYVVENTGLRTPASSDAFVFLGDSLTIRTDLSASTINWGTLINKHKGGTTKPITVAKMILENGRCAISDTYSSNKKNYSKTICGNIYINSGYSGFFGTSGTETDDRRMDVYSNLHGAGNLVLELCADNTTITLNATNGTGNAGFTGRVYIDHDGVHNTGNGGGTVNIKTAVTWFGEPEQADAGGVTFNGGGKLIFDFQDNVATGAKRGFTINNEVATIGVKSGCAVTIDGPIASAKGFNKTEAGTLALTGDNSGLTSAAVINANAGTLKLVGVSSAGSAALTMGSGAVLEIDPSQGAVEFGAMPSGLTALRISAASVDNPRQIDLFSYPSGTALDLNSIVVTTDLPSSVETGDMELVAVEDAQSGRTLVSYILPAGDAPFVSASLKSLTTSTATFTASVGYRDDSLTDQMSVVFCYGDDDAGTAVDSWDAHTEYSRAPGEYDFEIPVSADSVTYVAFRVQMGDGDPVWTSAVPVCAPVVSITADLETLVENNTDGVTITLTRPAYSAGLPLEVVLAYDGNTAAFASLPSSVTIPAGETSATLVLHPTDDSAMTADGTISVEVQSSGSYSVDAEASSVSVKVLDDEGLGGAVCLVPDPANPPAEAAALGRCVGTVFEAIEYGGYVAERKVYVFPGTHLVTDRLSLSTSLPFEGVPAADGTLPKIDLQNYPMWLGQNERMSKISFTGRFADGSGEVKQAMITLAAGAVFEDCEIVDCTAFFHAIRLSGDKAKLVRCRFSNCVSKNNGSSVVDATGSGTKYVVDTILENCKLSFNRYGGPLHIDNEGSIVMDHVIVSNCCGRAAVLRMDNGSAYVTNCLFAANDSDTMGWGILPCNSAKRLELVQTTFVNTIGRAVAFGGAKNGAISVNSIFWNNVTKDGTTGDISVGSYAYRIENSRYHEAVEGNENGNISADPMLKPDWTLRASSPCINAGRDIGWTATSVDLAGNPRVRGSAVDMGCFESSLKGLAIFVR